MQYFTIYGYARSKMTDEEFRDLISESLTCRLTDGEGCGQNMDNFLSRCFYQAVCERYNARGLGVRKGLGYSL